MMIIMGLAFIVILITMFWCLFTQDKDHNHSLKEGGYRFDK